MRVTRTGTSITTAGDARVTRVGRILRRFKIDELPQLFNVLRGEMSLVGPRPEIADFIDDDERWPRVLSVRPGITDLATLVFRNEEEVLASTSNPEDYYRRHVLPAKLDLNLKYMRARSARRDLKLLVLTLWYSLRPQRFNPQQVRKVFEA
jgi:lipopolysaccharide/colanic/teichoic acid biosynthesis glycosyltransferase